MSDIKNIKNIIEGNWDEIKGKIQSHWGKLTDDDMDQIAGSYRTLMGKLKKTYGYKSSEIEAEIIEFFDSSDFDKLISAAKNKIEGIKNIVFETMEEYFDTIKEKSIDAEKSVVDYVANNPYKIIAISAATGAIIGCLLRDRNR